MRSVFSGKVGLMCSKWTTIVVL